MTTMCLQCELFDCAGCEQWQAVPELGCCCGSVGPDELDADGQDWPDDIDDREVANGG